ncbi:unnamed protein product [Lathyrus oleraceus]
MNKLKEVIIREVWAHNLKDEFNLIQQAVHEHPFISMDTEFPGVIHTSKIDCRYDRSSREYSCLKANVDALKLIQIGLTLSDSNGNLPDFGSNKSYVWEFNFSDFDVNHDPCDQRSINMLRRQGIDFDRNFRDGVDSVHFAELFLSSRFVNDKSLVWITFSGAYDFGYLVKILTRKNLPNRLEDFLNVVQGLFGRNVYDMKHMMKFCNSLFGGLESVATILNVRRLVGKSHQAGSDSLLTWLAFKKMMDIYFKTETEAPKLAGVLFGLEIEAY